jgi:hypothetical protein
MPVYKLGYFLTQLPPPPLRHPFFTKAIALLSEND